MKTKVPSLVSIAILTVITSVFWVLFSVYRIFTVKPSPKVPQEILEPINPNLDTKEVDNIESRLYFEEGQIPVSSVTPSPSPIATATPLETPTPLATSTPIATATP